MSPKELAEVVVKLGLGAVGVLSIIYLFSYLLKNVLDQWKGIMEQHKSILVMAMSQNEMWMKQNEAWKKAIEDHTVQAREFHQQVKDAHFAQREGQERLIKILDGACHNIERLTMTTDEVCRKVVGYGNRMEERG